MVNHFNNRNSQKKIVVAMDSFKGSLTSLEAGNAVRDGILENYPDFDVQIFPVADGGEGTVEALTFGKEHVQARTISVTGPVGTEVQAWYTIYGQAGERTAVLEMAQAAGLPLVPEEKRNPMHTTTYGVGEMICDAIACGCRKFILGIGGSATNDAGIGMLQALGFRFLDQSGNTVSYGADGVRNIVSIDASLANPLLADCDFRIACDVTNPLCGGNGCSYIYGPQKGADPAMISQMDAWLSAFADLTQKIHNKKADKNMPGAGAAGGLGFAFSAYLGGRLQSGISIVLEETHMEAAIQDADLIITGEGRLDSQTVMGKAPVGIASLAKKYNKKVIAFCGCAADDAMLCNTYGIDAYFPILQKPVSLEEAMDPAVAGQNLKKTAEQVFRLLTCSA